jgi:hypothetical protein
MKTHKLAKTNNPDSGVRSFFHRHAKFWIVTLSFCMFAAYPATVSAVTLISQGFLSTGNLAPGSIVSLQSNSSEYVVLATSDNTNNILGVAINGADSEVSLSSNGANQVQVSTNGVEEVLISNINGNIAPGDSITASPIGGVGMKATSNVKVVGISQGSFPNNTESQQSYADKSGKKHTVLVGDVPVLVGVSYFYKQPNKTLIPGAVQNLANALAGKTVNTLPILISIGIFFVTLIAVVSIIYAMIHSSIISVGRNPMSQAAVYRNVVQLSMLVLVILGVAVISIYMVLTRL